MKNPTPQPKAAMPPPDIEKLVVSGAEIERTIAWNMTQAQAQYNRCIASLVFDQTPRKPPPLWRRMRWAIKDAIADERDWFALRLRRLADRIESPW